MAVCQGTRARSVRLRVFCEKFQYGRDMRGEKGNECVSKEDLDKAVSERVEVVTSL